MSATCFPIGLGNIKSTKHHQSASIWGWIKMFGLRSVLLHTFWENLFAICRSTKPEPQAARPRPKWFPSPFGWGFHQHLNRLAGDMSKCWSYILLTAWLNALNAPFEILVTCLPVKGWKTKLCSKPNQWTTQWKNLQLAKKYISFSFFRATSVKKENASNLNLKQIQGWKMCVTKIRLFIVTIGRLGQTTI